MSWSRRLIPPALFGALVLGGWQLYVGLSNVSSAVLPSPLEVARALADDRSLLLSSAATTLEEILLGYLLAVLVGVALALLVARSRVLERAIYPWLVASQLVPIPAIAPLVVLWTGFDIRPKLIIIALVSFFPIAVNTIDGLRSTDPELLDMLRTLGAGRGSVLRIARFPGALPQLFSGMRVATALAVIGAVFAEWQGSSSGLGSLILSDFSQTATADMLAAVVVLAAIGIALFALVGVLERVALPWYHGARSGG
jgi:ABC-type nitrate/sulfonate/bicarbonate transport system permease component